MIYFAAMLGVLAGRVTATVATVATVAAIVAVSAGRVGRDRAPPPAHAGPATPAANSVSPS